MHYAQAKAALLAGKHVLLEKPMTLENHEATELAKLAEDNNVVLSVGFHLRSHAGHRLLKVKIHSGVIGTIRHIRIIWAWPVGDDTNWRAKSEQTKWWSLSAVGSHCVDLARWFANDYEDFVKLNATLTNAVFNGPHDETAVVSAELSKGASVEVTSSVLFGPYNRIELFGDKGRAVCVDTLGREGAGRIAINDEDIVFDVTDPFLTQLQNIVNHIDNRVELNAPSEAGVRSVKDLNKILEI
jgi:predicted dehydrogenase